MKKLYLRTGRLGLAYYAWTTDIWVGFVRGPLDEPGIATVRFARGNTEENALSNLAAAHPELNIDDLKANSGE
jgi:hypothetical protein